MLYSSKEDYTLFCQVDRVPVITLIFFEDWFYAFLGIISLNFAFTVRSWLFLSLNLKSGVFTTGPPLCRDLNSSLSPPHHHEVDEIQVQLFSLPVDIFFWVSSISPCICQ